MARATLRSREIALRLALGASRRRLMRMLLTESLVLSALGGVLGIALGYGLLRWIQSLLPPFYFPAEASIGMDGRVLGFLAIVTMFTSVAFGLTPALRASRRDAADALKEGGRGSSAGRRDVFVRHAFVAAQVTAAFILLAGAGLLLRSFYRVMDVDMGYDTEGIVAAYLPLAESGRSRAGGADAVHPADPRRGALRAGRTGHRGGDRHPAARLGRRHAVPHAREAG